MPSTTHDHQPTDGGADASELDRRKAAILEAVVAEYIGTAQPVGSSHVARAPGVQVSSATVRSEMVALEHEGYLVQPHTSAGRIPTDKGYRFFVDHLTEPGVLGPAQHLKVSQFFDQVHGEMEQVLERASGLLSELTSCAAVVMGPSHDTATIRSIQLVGLGPRLGLLVVVLSDGAVDKRTVEFDFAITDALVGQATQLLQQHLCHSTISAATTVPPSGQVDVDRAVTIALAALADLVRPGEPEQIFVGGPSRLAESFDAVETVRSVLSILEQQMVVVTLLRDVLGRGLSVAIGTEHGYEPLAECAVVVAGLSIDGHDAGAIGLLGPTRMDYPRALAAAHVVGERLGQRIGESTGAEGGSRGEH